MKQFNINITPEFEKNLQTFMKARNLKHKADAIRRGFQELVASLKSNSKFDFRGMMGIGLSAPLNPKPKFESEDDLWS